MLRMQLSTAQRRCELAGMLEPHPIHKRMPSAHPGQHPDSRTRDTSDEDSTFQERRDSGEKRPAQGCFVSVFDLFPRRKHMDVNLRVECYAPAHFGGKF